MAFDHVLAQRIEDLLPEAQGRSMFGGKGYFIDGNMCCGIMQDRLMVRLGKEATPLAVEEEGVEPFSPGGKTMGGWVVVEQELLAEDDELMTWIQKGVAFAAMLPPK